MLKAHFAVPMIRAALVSVNIRLSAREVAYILDHSDAKVLVVDNEFAPLVDGWDDLACQVQSRCQYLRCSQDMRLAGTNMNLFWQLPSRPRGLRGQR
ncbi:MAG: AMP-binding protein [Desulfobacterales bacterium]